MLLINCCSSIGNIYATTFGYRRQKWWQTCNLFINLWNIDLNFETCRWIKLNYSLKFSPRFSTTSTETVAERQIIIFMMINLSKNYRKSVTSLSFSMFSAFYASQFVTYLDTGNPHSGCQPWSELSKSEKQRWPRPQLIYTRNWCVNIGQKHRFSHFKLLFWVTKIWFVDSWFISDLKLI